MSESSRDAPPPFEDDADPPTSSRAPAPSTPVAVVKSSAQGVPVTQSVVMGTPLSEEGGGGAVGLPPNWQQAYDDQGRPYYVNYNVSPPHTQYEQPGSAQGRLPPPPPPPGSYHDQQQQHNQPMTLALAFDEMQREEVLEFVRLFGKQIGCWALIHIVLCIIDFVISFNPIYLALLIGPVCGMHGSQNFKSGFIVVYMIFLLLNVLVHIIAIFLAQEFLELLIGAINIFIYCYVLKKASLFHKILTTLVTPEEIGVLRAMNNEQRRGPQHQQQRAAGP